MYNVAVNVPEAVLYDTHMDERQVSMFAKRSVAPVLCDLQSNCFYVTKNVRDMVLASAGEAQRRK